MDSSINGRHLAEFPGFKGDAYDVLVNHRRGATTLCDENFSF